MASNDPKVRRVKIAEVIKPDRQNANRHTERGQFFVSRSLSERGAGRSVLLDKDYELIAGNLTTEQAIAAGIENAIIIDSDGTELIAVRRVDMDLDDPDTGARAMAYDDNRAAQASIDFNPAQIIADARAGTIDPLDYWRDTELEKIIAGGLAEEIGAASVVIDAMLPDDQVPPAEGVPDTIWPTDNEFGIPSLLLTYQADALDIPIETWGAKQRGTRAGTIHFYTEDYRFRALWQNPADPLRSKAVNMVEPNYSVGDTMPLAVAIWRTYQKRWLGRYWQTQGRRLFVDLNVARPYDAINLLGVPRGWRAYATRGYSDRLQALMAEREIAIKHAETDDITLFVYGGGEKVRQWAAQYGAFWVPEDADRAKGKYLDHVPAEGN